jgi:hypothetical protein
MPMKHKDCEERNEPATERGLAAIQSPRKPNGLSHCIFECLIVEASSRIMPRSLRSLLKKPPNHRINSRSRLMGECSFMT